MSKTIDFADVELAFKYLRNRRVKTKRREGLYMISEDHLLFMYHSLKEGALHSFLEEMSVHCADHVNEIKNTSLE